MGFQIIKVESEGSNREIKNVNDKYDLRVGFDDIFKADNHILSIVSRTNGMIDWMVRNFFFKGGKCF